MRRKRGAAALAAQRRGKDDRRGRQREPGHQLGERVRAGRVFPPLHGTQSTLPFRSERPARGTRRANLLRRRPRGTAPGGARLLSRARRRAGQQSLGRALRWYGGPVVLPERREVDQRPLTREAVPVGAAVTQYSVYLRYSGVRLVPASKYFRSDTASCTKATASK